MLTCARSAPRPPPPLQAYGPQRRISQRLCTCFRVCDLSTLASVADTFTQSIFFESFSNEVGFDAEMTAPARAHFCMGKGSTHRRRGRLQTRDTRHRHGKMRAAGLRSPAICRSSSRVKMRDGVYVSLLTPSRMRSFARSHAWYRKGEPHGVLTVLTL